MALTCIFDECQAGGGVLGTDWGLFSSALGRQSGRGRGRGLATGSLVLHALAEHVGQPITGDGPAQPLGEAVLSGGRVSRQPRSSMAATVASLNADRWCTALGDQTSRLPVIR